MKKTVVLITMLGVIFLQTSFSLAQILSSKELAVAKKEELNNTEWTIAITPMSERDSAETDVISFVDGKIISKNLQDAGYVATDFTVRVKEDETVIWETMQVDYKDNFAFWRGDIKDGVMRGVLTKRDKRGRTSDFSFVSQ